MKRVLVINDICCFGKASITEMLPVLSAMGIECSLIPTVLLSAHTGGLGQVHRVDLSEDMLKIAGHFKELQLHFDAIYVGYLAGIRQIDTVCQIIDLLKDEDTLVFMDPSMADNGKLYSGFEKDYPEKLKVLLKKNGCLLPNVTELCLLCDEDPKAEIDWQKLNTLLYRLSDECNGADVILSGVENHGRLQVSVLQDDICTEYIHKKIEGHFHGCGDLFAAVVIGNVLKGKKLTDAVEKAALFVLKCIEKTVEKGTDERYGLSFEEVIENESSVN